MVQCIRWWQHYLHRCFTDKQHYLTLLLIELFDSKVTILQLQITINKYLNFNHWRISFIHFPSVWHNLQNLPAFLQKIFLPLHTIGICLGISNTQFACKVSKVKCNSDMQYIRVQLHHAEINSTQLLTYAICGLGGHQYWSFLH